MQLSIHLSSFLNHIACTSALILRLKELAGEFILKTEFKQKLVHFNYIPLDL